jgi:hypothetical protein
MSNEVYTVRAHAVYAKCRDEEYARSQREQVVRRKIAFYVRNAVNQWLIDEKDAKDYEVEFSYEPKEGFDSVGNRKIIGQAKFPAMAERP